VSSPLLEAENVSVSHSGRDVVRDVCLTVRPGELWAVLGPNGAGKSTFLRACAALRPVSNGHIRVKDRVLSEWDRNALAREVAWLSQSSEEAWGFRGLEYVLLGRAPHQSAWAVPSDNDVARAMAALEEVGLRHLAGRNVTQCSGGERRLLAVARAFVQESPLLLLDEPTAFLDLRHQVELLRRVRARVVRGAGALVILHDVNLAWAFANKALLMRDGQVLARGDADTVLTAAHLERLYGVSVREASNQGQRFFAPELKP
jgi:iron complex transport system ATP-binding protein